MVTNNYFIIREVCPGCKSPNHNRIHACSFVESPIKEYLEEFYDAQGHIELKYLMQGKYILVECTDCGMIYQEEIPNNVLMEKLYEEWIDPQMAFEEHVQNNDLDYYARHAEEVMRLIAYLNKKPSELTVLDFGMGWGKWCQMMRGFGCEVYGSELSETRIEYGKANGVKVISTEEVSKYRFNVINAEQVFEHIAEPLEVLCYLSKSLEKNGLIKIGVPNGGDIKRRLRNMDWGAPKGSRNSLNAVSPLEHINCYNRASIIRMADIAGLERVNIPLCIEYAYTINWKLVTPAIKNIVRPLYRKLLQNSTRVVFREKK